MRSNLKRTLVHSAELQVMQFVFVDEADPCEEIQVREKGDERRGEIEDDV